MIKVNRYSWKSLPTNTSIDKYFYLTINQYYSSSSNYIYICLEDSSFSLDYSNLKFCYTNYDPYYYAEDAVRNCSFSSTSYYGYNYHLSPRYFYKFNMYNYYQYLIVSYNNGSYSNKRLYVHSDYNDYLIVMAQIVRDVRKSLPTITSKKNIFI